MDDTLVHEKLFAELEAYVKRNGGHETAAELKAAEAGCYRAFTKALLRRLVYVDVAGAREYVGQFRADEEVAL